jgi:predicted ribosomally synthesized peptide with nif11-like leader
MAKIKTLTKEQLQKAAMCKNADELMKLAKSEGFDLTKDEAEAYLAELADVELDDEMLQKAAGGVCWTNCPKEAECPGHVCGTVGWENFKGC